ncbi:MAG: Bacterial lipid biosynthesis acyltransferase [Chloroflexi bacterium]|nr:Bacterial lipid biosynthesis acyltransferase [Chloroflexota bacterium]
MSVGRTQGEDQLYLHGTLVVIRPRRKGWYLVLHPRSAAVIFTDALGAHAVRLFLLGHGVSDIAVKVERRAAGAGARWQRMAAALYEMGTTGPQVPNRSMRWWVRRAGTLAFSSGMSILSDSLRHLPVWLLRGMFEAAPATPLGKRAHAHLQPFIVANLCASEFAARSPDWQLYVAGAVTAATIRCRFVEYLMLVLPQSKLGHFFQSISNERSMHRVVQELQTDDGCILVGLHTEQFYTAIFNVCRAAPVAILADIALHEHSIAARRDLPSLPFARYVGKDSRMAGRTLIDWLRAGKIVLLAFDIPPPPTSSGTKIETVSFLGQDIARFETAAWLSMRTGKPIRFISSYRQGRRLMMEVSSPISPATDVSPTQQIASLTEHVYKEAERFLHKHPESWLVWSYWHTLIVPAQ